MGPLLLTAYTPNLYQQSTWYCIMLKFKSGKKIIYHI
jgi:hypothetical protein